MTIKSYYCKECYRCNKKFFGSWAQLVKHSKKFHKFRHFVFVGDNISCQINNNIGSVVLI